MIFPFSCFFPSIAHFALFIYFYLKFTLQTGKVLTAKGMEVVELIGKETMELLITETGIEVEKNAKEDEKADEEQFQEEATFDRCFYIYGGPEQLEVACFLISRKYFICSLLKFQFSVVTL